MFSGNLWLYFFVMTRLCVVLLLLYSVTTGLIPVIIVDLLSLHGGWQITQHSRMSIYIFRKKKKTTLWKVTLRRAGNLSNRSAKVQSQLEIWLRPTWLDLGRFDLKLLQRHFAVKFSKAEAQQGLRRTWLISAKSATSSQCQGGGSKVAQAAGKGYLTASELTLWPNRQVVLPSCITFCYYNQNQALKTNRRHHRLLMCVYYILCN